MGPLISLCIFCYYMRIHIFVELKRKKIAKDALVNSRDFFFSTQYKRVKDRPLT